MLTILAITGPFILIGLLCIVSVPTQSRLGLLTEHPTKIMESTQDYDSSVDPIKSQEEEDDLAADPLIPAVTKPRPQKRFTSIDFMSNGNFSVASADFTIPSYFSVDLSTEENYNSDDLDFYGDYDTVRSTLDYSYHGVSYPDCSIFLAAVSINMYIDINQVSHQNNVHISLSFRQLHKEPTIISRQDNSEAIGWCISSRLEEWHGLSNTY